MMTRPHCVVMALLLLAEVSRFGEGASNPGFVVRITKRGLEYARQYGMAILKKELSTINVPDLSGSFKAGWMGSVSYEFTSLRIRSFQIRDSDLSLFPKRGVRASLSNNYMSIQGNWKVKKAFVTLQGTFDLSMDGASISIYLNLGKDRSGRPTASVAHCSNSVGHISIHISGHLSWLLNLFHKRIENKIKDILKQEICRIVRMSTSSYLEPYLRTLPVTMMIDQVAGIDYSLVGAPQVTSQGLDTPFKGEFFSRSQRTPVPFDAPPIRLPPEHNRMAYFAVSQYVFNTASRVYHEAGHMNFTIRNEDIQKLTMLLSNHSAKKWWNPNCLDSETTPFTTMISCFVSSHLLLLLQIPLDFPIQLHTKSLGAVIPQLSRLYPNTELELEISPESAPFLIFTPGNVTFKPVMNIQAFALMPNSSNHEPLFQLRAVRLLESIFNYYASYIIFPSFNEKLEEGFPLPLPRDTYLNSVQLQIHKAEDQGGSCLTQKQEYDRIFDRMCLVSP
ncbi:lipopolysaccharide-binding protein-like [Pipistrellus kuhlii]|uniref:lipopolysaccharide-binding protein-like n=1 Tax=Pipistrellus kuhlii TaxID=59472 RepID=UPI001E26EA90|nr:lipopolysaccharide-binding protein-like [Pipistrellus kuhlii]